MAEFLFKKKFFKKRVEDLSAHNALLLSNTKTLLSNKERYLKNKPFVVKELK